MEVVHSLVSCQGAAAGNLLLLMPLADLQNGLKSPKGEVGGCKEELQCRGGCR